MHVHTRWINNNILSLVRQLVSGVESAHTAHTARECVEREKNIKFSENINHILAIFCVLFQIVLSQFKFTASIYITTMVERQFSMCNGYKTLQEEDKKKYAHMQFLQHTTFYNKSSLRTNLYFICAWPGNYMR